MGENSAIQWTHHTFNPWTRCEKVSPACDNCYAETWANPRAMGHRAAAAKSERALLQLLALGWSGTEQSLVEIAAKRCGVERARSALVGESEARKAEGR